jgi:hypothetical protein
MKLTVIVLFTSVALNAALGIALALRPSDEHRNAHETTLAAAAPAQLARPESAHWQELEPLDHRSAIQRLQAAGLPPYLVQAIITARIDEEYEPRTLPLIQAVMRRAYWRSGPGEAGAGFADATTRASLRELTRERSEKLRTLLGPEADPDFQNPYRRQRYGDLPTEKVELLESIEQDYQELTAEIHRRAGGVMLAEDREAIAFLEAEKQTDIAKALTPEERDAYELRTSGTASRLRHRLAAFEPSEEEYIALYRLHKSHEDRTGGGTPTAAQEQQRMEAGNELNQQIAALLGPERFAEYELRTDSNWRPSAEWVKQQQLPEATTSKLVTIHRDLTQQASRIRAAARDLSPEERNAKLAALGAEARQRLGELLNPSQLAAYEKGPGNWLRRLQPPRP